MLGVRMIPGDGHRLNPGCGVSGDNSRVLGRASCPVLPREIASRKLLCSSEAQSNDPQSKPQGAEPPPAERANAGADVARRDVEQR
jgi:hypothetical protein